MRLGRNLHMPIDIRVKLNSCEKSEEKGKANFFLTFLHISKDFDGMNPLRKEKNSRKSCKRIGCK